MTCARREAGARRPAPSTSIESPRRPEPRPGRARARLFGLLPALAPLLGALLLLHAAQAQAQAPAAPTNLSVSAGNAALLLSWTAPTGTFTGYDVHYTSAPASGSGAVGNNVAVQTGGSATAASGWLAVTRSGTTATQTISSLTNSVGYRVRVRAKTSSVRGAWVFGTGSPSARAATLAAPTNLSVSAGDAQLSLTWTAPTGTLTGYDVHYTSAAVSSNAVASGGNPATAWVAVTRSGTTASQTISSLTNRTAYRVRVRAKTSSVNGAWVFGSGTPASPTTVSLSVFPTTVAEGGLVSVIATLSAAAAVTIPITVTLDSAEAGDFSAGTLAGLRAGFAFPTNQKQKVFNLGIAQDTDTQDEKFTVALGTLPTGYAAGAVTSVTVTIEDDETKPTVSSLRTIPSPPLEGESFSIGVTLSALPAVAVNIPLTVTLGTAEPEDFDATELDYLRSNGIPLITTGDLRQASSPLTVNTDLDREDETFTVAIDPDGLAELGVAMAPGAATSLEVTIKDLPWLVLKIDEGDRELLIGPAGELGLHTDPRPRWVEVSPTTRSVTLTLDWVSRAIAIEPTAQVRYVMHGIDGDTLTWEIGERNTSKTLELYSPLGSPGYPRLTLSAGNGLDYTIYFRNNSRWEFHQDTLLKILEMRTQSLQGQ